MGDLDPPLDRWGVEVLSADQIEECAQQTIRSFDAHLLQRPCVIPVEDFAASLDREGKLVFEASADIGDADSARHVVGLFEFKPPTIQIDRSMRGTARRFALAHELGHFVLHRDRDVLEDDYLIDDEETIFGKPPARYWMEWQANRFAAALLMPQNTLETVIHAVLPEARRLKGNARRAAIARYVAASFEVGLVAARRRLEEIERLAAKWAT